MTSSLLCSARIVLVVVLPLLSSMPMAANARPLNAPPGTPTLISPRNGGNVAYSDWITFVWHSSADADPGDQVTYKMMICRQHTTETLYVDVVDTTTTLNLPYDMDKSSTYIWCVWAQDQWGNVSLSSQKWSCSNFPSGNADGIPPNGVPDISDVVYIIAFIFGGGPAPNPI